MSSGVKIGDDVKTAFSAQQMKHKCPFVVYKIENGKVVVEKEAKEDEGFNEMVTSLKAADEKGECRYVTYDCPDGDEAHSGKGAKGNLCLIAWSNDNCASIKNKMVYASTLTEMKKAVDGVKKCFECHSFDELSPTELSQQIKHK